MIVITDEAAIMRALLSWPTTNGLIAASSVLWENQDVAQSALPSATIVFLHGKMSLWPDSRKVQDITVPTKNRQTLNYYYESFWQLDILTNVRSNLSTKDANQIARELCALSKSPTVMDAFSAAKATLVGPDTIVKSDEVVADTQRLKRAVLEFGLNYFITLQDAAGTGPNRVNTANFTMTPRFP